MRYKRGKIEPEDEISKIFERYSVAKETEFVKNFFEIEEINAILEECGFESLTEDDDYTIHLEYPVRIGVGTPLRADLVIKTETKLYYFEVMSQSALGRWDNSHHYQYLLKSFKLKQETEEVYCFAISFREFDSAYLEDIEKDSSMFGIHLRFSGDHYYVDVYGKDVKVKTRKEGLTAKMENIKEISSKLIKLSDDRGCIKDKRTGLKASWFSYIGKGHENSKYGLEVGMHLKDRASVTIHGAVQHLLEISREEILVKMQKKFPDASFTLTGKKAFYIAFPFDYDSYTDKDLEKALDYLEEFASIIGYSHYLKNEKA